MRPGIATLISVLLLTGALALSPPAWMIATLAVFALATAGVDIARARQARVERT